MRGVFLGAFGTTLIASVALAQSHPLHLSGRAHQSSQLSCSQSWQSSSEAVSVTLDVDANQRVTMAIDRTYRSSGGSQPMFGRGYSDQTINQEHAEVSLIGTARQSPHALDLDMTEMTLATARWHGEGTLPLGAPTTRAVTLHIHCDESTLPVYDASDLNMHPPEGAPTHDTTFYVCQFTDAASAGWGEFMSEYTDHIFPLAQVPIGREDSRGGPFAGSPFFRFLSPH